MPYEEGLHVEALVFLSHHHVLSGVVEDQVWKDVDVDHEVVVVDDDHEMV